MNYDLTSIEKNEDVKSMSVMLGDFEIKADKLVIKSNDTELQAIDMTKQITGIRKSIDGKRKEFTGPANAFIKKVNEMLMPAVKKADSISTAIRIKLSNYRDMQEKKMKESTKIETKAKETATSKMTYRKDWVFDVIDEKKIPREFLTVDTIKIGYAIKNGIRKIDGVKIFEKSVPVIR